jgi:hypothetical protein
MCSICGATVVNIWPTNEYNDKTITLNQQFFLPQKHLFLEKYWIYRRYYTTMAIYCDLHTYEENDKSYKECAKNKTFYF